MDRKAFLVRGLACGVGSLLPGCCATLVAAEPSEATDRKSTEDLSGQLSFVRNWVSDLMGTMNRRLDEETVAALMEGCGDACYRRFKEFITREADGDMEKLIDIYNSRWAGPGSVVRTDPKTIEVRYRMAGCTCPVAHGRSPSRDEMHCHCSKGSIKAIFSSVAGRPLKVDLMESLRRGDPQCRFTVHL